MKRKYTVKKQVWISILLFILLLSLCGCSTDSLKEGADKKAQIMREMAENAKTDLKENAGSSIKDFASGVGEGLLNTLGAFTEDNKYDALSDLFYGYFDTALTSPKEVSTEEVREPLWGSEPPQDSTESQTDFTVPAPTYLEPVTLEKIVDGDTLWVTDKNGNKLKVRLIGIDTPESVHTDEEKNTVWGTYASDHTKKILEETQTVYLEYDENTLDRFERTLAYVWISSDTSDLDNMLNYIILKDGYAMAKVYEPNVKYEAVFDRICDNSINNKIGLWNEADFCSLWLPDKE